LSEPELAKRSIGLGHSLGCAVALESANRHGWSEVVAISPFTSMKAMARRQVGSVLAAFLRHHYDNEVALDELLVSNSNSRVTIFHGENDALIPITMGQSLAERDESGEKVVFIGVPRAGHNDIIMHLEVELMARFNQP
jgi:pimeloyl-ACP methyl ester carboxylesterase